MTGSDTNTRSDAMATMTQPVTRTLDAPGVVLTYDVRPNEDGAHLPLFMIASPMGAAGFGTLASYFADRTVVTYDPRGVERSVKADPASQSTPEQHADDLHRIIAALGGRPVDLFATSGGAINALALVAAHPEAVRTLIAHEPPLASLVPDREFALAAARAIHDEYMRNGSGPAMARFMALVMHTGLIDQTYLDQPAPDPAMFGMSGEDDGTRTDPLLGQNILTSTAYEPDIDALRAASTRIVIAAGAESRGELAHRGAEAVAERLRTQAVTFPSTHGGFLGGEYGQTGDPEAFAAKLREVLTAA
jgi:pimeloyl-ACP methyl ester carboxylesterase